MTPQNFLVTIMFTPDSVFIPWLLNEFHASAKGEHVGAYRTYRRLAANVYWPRMMELVTIFVVRCLICQKNKYDTKGASGFAATTPSFNACLGRL